MADGKVELGWENWSEFAQDAAGLMQEEYDEYQALQGLEDLSLNQAEMQVLSDAGRLNVLCARDRGVPVGYFMLFISMDPEVSWQVIATQGAWYVKNSPQYTKLGLLLWLEAKAFVKNLGIKIFDLHHPMVGRGARLAPFFLRQGARPLNTTYRLKL